MRTIQLSQLASLIGGHLVVHGRPLLPADEAIEISHALPLQDAGPACLTLVDHDKHVSRLNQSRAAAVLVKEVLPNCTLPMIVVSHLHSAFEQAIGLLRAPLKSATQLSAREPAIHATACIAPTARLGSHCDVGPGVVIGQNCHIGDRCKLHSGVQLMDDCVLGDDCELFPHATLYPGSRLGQRVLIHAGAVLGAYGFGYRQLQGQHVRTAQLGWVEIADDVEIGASTTIDRGTYGPTRIGQGTKIDNQVQIGHNCHIGSHNLICAQVGIAGSTSTGDNVVLAGQVGIADHLHLADNVRVGAQSGIMNNVPAGQTVVGSPAAPHRQRMLEWAMVARLPELRRELKALQEQMAELTAGVSESESSPPLHRRSA